MTSSRCNDLLHVPESFGYSNFPGRWMPPSWFWARLLSRLRRGTVQLLATLVFGTVCHPTAQAQIVVSGNENKMDLRSGEQVVVFDAEPDSISVIDFSQFPPAVEHVFGIPNSVIGPPSNVVISPDGKLALISSSLKLDANSEKGYVPDTRVNIVDLTISPPQLTGQVHVGRQPSGISITPDGRRALVANRAEGTITVLSISGTNVHPTQTLVVGSPDDQVSDVAISPDGKLALVSVVEGFHLRVLALDEDAVRLTDRKLSVCGKPYRTAITADGQLGLTAGSGQGAPDRDALSIIDLTAKPIRTIDYVALGVGPESFGVSPDGKLIAVMLMNGSNVPRDDPHRTENGQLLLLARRDKTYVPVQRIPIGRITQGAAFTSDGKYLLVECYADREIWVFRVKGELLEDTGHRIKTPGFPSSIRASP